MTRRLFGRLFTSAAIGTLLSFAVRPLRPAAADDGIVIYKGWILKTSDFER